MAGKSFHRISIAIAALSLSSLLTFPTRINAFQIQTSSTRTSIPSSSKCAGSYHDIARLPGHAINHRSIHAKNRPIPTYTYHRTKLQAWSSDELQGPDKIKACVPYMLPLLDGDFFGKYIYQRIPPLGFIDEYFIAPLVSILEAYPLLPLLLFVLLIFGTRVNAANMSRNVRFNAQQACLIDCALILPTIIQEGLVEVDVPRGLAECGCNFVWYFYMSAIVYSVTMNLRGRKPSGLPYLSDAAEIMTGPF